MTGLDESKFVMVGRDSEQTALVEGFERAAHGERQLFLVQGEAGCGKTTLLRHFSETLAQRGATILLGPSMVGTFLSYEPFVVAIDTYAAGMPAHRVLEELGESISVLKLIVPQLAAKFSNIEATQIADPLSARLLIARAFINAIGRLAQGRPVVFILEDLHLASESTVGLLIELINASADWNLMILGAIRSTELRQETALAQLVNGDMALIDPTGIALGPLERSSIDQIANQLSPVPLDPQLIDHIAKVTEGNPFFVTEFVRNVVDSAIPSEARRDVPDSVKEVISSRLERLSAATRDSLRRASTLGRDFQLDVWAKIVGSDEVSIRKMANEAVRASVIGKVGGFDVYSFSHALIADTLYDELTPVVQERMHREVGSILEGHYGDEAPIHSWELAYHYMRGGPSVQEKAISFSLIAGWSALENGDFFTAGEQFANAARELVIQPEGPERDALEFQLRLGALTVDMSTRGFGVVEVQNNLANIRALRERLPENPDTLPAIASLSMVEFIQGHFDRAIALLDEAVELARSIASPGDVLRNQGMICAAYIHSGRTRESLDTLSQAMPLLDHPELLTPRYQYPGQVDGEGLVLAQATQAAWLDGRPDDALSFLERALDRAAKLPEQHQPFVIANTSWLYMYARLYEMGAPVLDPAIEIAEAFGLAQWNGWLRVTRGRCLVGTGVPEGIDEMKFAIDMWRMTGTVVALPSFLLWYADACFSLDRNEEALAALDESDAIVAVSGETTNLSENIRLRAQVVRALIGEHDQFAFELRRAIGAADERGAKVYGLRACADLATWEILGAQSHRALAELTLRYESFDQGLNTPDLVSVRALITQLSNI